MSQADTLRAFDAAAAAAFRNAGMGDAATYTPDGGSPVDCTALVDREAQEFGEGLEPVSGTRVVVTLFLDEVSNPEQGDAVAVGSESWILFRELERDESRSRWVVRP